MPLMMNEHLAPNSGERGWLSDRNQATVLRDVLVAKVRSDRRRMTRRKGWKRRCGKHRAQHRVGAFFSVSSDTFLIIGDRMTGRLSVRPTSDQGYDRGHEAHTWTGDDFLHAARRYRLRGTWQPRRRTPRWQSTRS